MQLIYSPKTELEEFASKIYFLLVENFFSTYYVGGMVRDVLLRKPVYDIDIATQATPEEIIAILQNAGIVYDALNQKFGVIKAVSGTMFVEITTLRKEVYRTTRFPEVSFTLNPEEDSYRRDFTINSLYLLKNDNTVLDFHKGEKDLKQKKIRFIGEPETRITEDPLRILRALRFSLSLDFALEENTFLAIKNKINLVSKLSKSKIISEIEKINGQEKKEILISVLHKPKTLDTYFKKI